MDVEKRCVRVREKKTLSETYSFVKENLGVNVFISSQAKHTDNQGGRSRRRRK